MAKIPLRVYIKDVENLIERGEIEQAIAHAKNILQAYPKHIETYRLLGKAYLESQRYSEATDILQRVLSVVPDDFVSQIGISIIREDEGNFDAAIWHMERAYEVQPFNPAVQDELRRLYGRRDGSEPPKIRLTRGALIRMYARGELFPQAIAETRAALAEDAQRLDLLVLLARLYFLNGQKVEATEVCSSLISKLPYCYEANLILTDVLPGTSRADDARTFQQRLYALDPYAAYLSPSAPTANQVPDQAVMVEQFMFDAALDQQDQRPEWTRNVGVEWDETEDEQLPDWLNTLSPKDQAPAAPATDYSPDQSETQAAEPAGADEDGVPDWMKSAGWAKTDRSADEIMKEQLQFAEDDPTIDAEAAPAEIPDWLQTMAPPADAEELAREQERLNLLDSILPGQPSEDSSLLSEASLLPDDEDDSLDWLTGAPSGVLEPDSASDLSKINLFGDNIPAETSAEDILAGENPSSEVPDWLSGFGGEQPAEQPATPSEGVTPDWLSSLGSDVTIIQPPTDAPSAPDRPIDDWLNSMGSDDALLDDTTPAESGSDWLAQMSAADAQPADEAPTETAGEHSASTSWMSSFEDERAAADMPVVEQPSDTSEDLPDWLKGADIDLIIPAPQIPADDLLTAAQAETWQPEDSTAMDLPQPAADALPAREEMPTSGILSEMADPGAAPAEPEQAAAPDLSDMDAAMAWLESLAAKHGADEATLVTRPEDRLDAPPDWVTQEAAAAGPDELLQEEMQAVSPAGELPAAEELPAAQELSSAESVAAAADTSAPDDFSAFEADAPSWRNAASEAPETDQPASGLDHSNELPAWLTSLDGDPAPATDEMTAEESLATLPTVQDDETLAAEADLPDWLIAAQAETQAGQTPSDDLSTQDDLPAAEIQPAVDDGAELSDIWAVEQAPQESEVTAAEEQTAAPASQSEAPDFSDMDAAMAWLESLAAKHGADEATLVTPPEDRLEAPPDWVQQQIESRESTQPVRVNPEAETQPPAAESAAQQPEDMPEATLAADTQPVDEELVLPDWMQADAQTPAEETELPDWMADEMLLAQAAQQPEASAEDLAETEAQAAESASLMEAPIEMEQPEAAQPSAAVDVPELADSTSAEETGAMPDFSDTDAAMAWLESLAAKHGADEATLVTRPEDRLDTPPDWVTQEMVAGEAAASEPESALASPDLAEDEAEPPAVLKPDAEDASLVPPTSEIAPEAESSETVETSGETDFDATFAWLESLAAKQGAQEGSLITDPEDRQAETPEWVQNMADEESRLANEAGPALESEPLSSEASGWLAQESGEVDDGQPSEADADAPAWFESSLEEEPLVDQTAPRNIDVSPAEWLPEMPEAPTVSTEPDANVEELPAWLQQVETGESAAEAETAPKASLEDWLQTLESESVTPPNEFFEEVPPPLTPETWQVEETVQPAAIDPSLTGQAALSAAQAALNRGRLEPALETYNRLITNEELLDDVIHDLRDALYRYPVDISLWQLLGDAFARNNQLQEALNAYTKAEELLR